MSAMKEKEAILNSMSDPVIYLDKNLRVLWVNSAMSESLKYPYNGKESAQKIYYFLYHGMCADMWDRLQYLFTKED